MIKALAIGLVFALSAGTVFAAGSIISSFQSPFHPTDPQGIDYYGGYLWHVSYSSRWVYQTTTTGSVVSTFLGPSFAMGVECVGSSMWICTYSSYIVFHMTTTGSILNSFVGPTNGYGITSDGTYLWFSSARNGNMIYKLTTTGSVLNSFSGPRTANGDLDYANGYLWVADWPVSGGGIYRITTTGGIVESYRPVPSRSQPPGVCWDGNNVWYNNYSDPHYVYQMDTVHVGIQPASVGRVKALFR